MDSGWDSRVLDSWRFNLLGTLDDAAICFVIGDPLGGNPFPRHPKAWVKSHIERFKYIQLPNRSSGCKGQFGFGRCDDENGVITPTGIYHPSALTRGRRGTWGPVDNRLGGKGGAGILSLTEAWPMNQEPYFCTLLYHATIPGAVFPGASRFQTRR